MYLLPLISKDLEKVIHDETNAFLKGNNLLYNYRSEFRTNNSTILYLSFLTDKILKRFDKGVITGVILIDLQKAFDTITHENHFKKNLSHGLLLRIHYMVSVTSFWKNIFHKYRKPTFCLWKNIVWHSTRFNPKAFTFPYLCQWHAQVVNSYLFLYAGDSSYIPT